MREKPPLLKRVWTKNIGTLCAAFDACLDEYNRSQLFGNVTEHLYHRTLTRRRQVAFEALSSDALFADYSYAALATWMGWRDLVAFDQFQEALSEFVLAATDLTNTSILELDGNTTEQITTRLADLFDTARLTTARSQTVVAPSKLLHFLLPNLVPPIDGRYTLKFLFGRNGAPSGYSNSELFRVAFAECVYIAGRNAPSIHKAVEANPRLSPGHAKVVDNAIIGFMLIGTVT
jgi:hypothetical protein